MKPANSKGITLMELLIAIAITGILAGVTVLTLGTAMDSYGFIQDEVFLQKYLDDALAKIIEGGFESYGIKDSLEMVEAATDSITFVPLWVDDGHIVKVPSVGRKQEFVLGRPFKAGAGFPIGEILIEGAGRRSWQTVPIVFLLNEDRTVAGDRVFFYNDVNPGTKARFLYHPDISHFPESAMTIRRQNEKITRQYRSRRENLLKKLSSGIVLQGLRFSYFDNTNTEIVPPRDGKLSAAQIAAVSAVKVTLQLELNGKSKQGSAFVNIRNTRTTGSGLILREGTTIPIPNSRQVRALSLLNIAGVKAGGRITLAATTSTGRSWRLHIDLNKKDGKDMIERYTIEYPAGQKVFSERPQLTTDIPLNFLTLGGNGRYDYDVDGDVDDVVELDGDVQLTVLKMQAAGAALFVRP